MIQNLLKQGFLKHITQINLLVIFGLFFSQTPFLLYLNHFFNVFQISPILIICLWISTILLIACVLLYVFKEVYFQYINLYQFLILPIFTILTVNQIKAHGSLNFVIWSLILIFIGIIISSMNIFLFYSRNVINKENNILRISVHYRLLRIVRFVGIILIYLANIQPQYKIISLQFAILSVINIYFTITKFSFQSVYHEHLTIIFSFGSLISSIQSLVYAQQLTKYSFLGQFSVISLVLIEPTFIVDILELKYTFFMEKNIQMRDPQEMLAVFKIMKQIILRENHSLDYSIKFKNKVYLSYQSMLQKSKKLFRSIGYFNRNLQYNDLKGSSSIGSVFNFAAIQSILSQEQVFYNLMNVRLLKNEDFHIWEFYIISLANKKLKSFNKSISEYYKKKIDLKKIDIFQNIMRNLLYKNILKFVPFRQNQYRQHQSIIFYRLSNNLIEKIKQICKNQSDIISMLSSSSSLSLAQYKEKLCIRNQMKSEISKIIKQMMSFSFYKFSSLFFYTVFLFKLFFEREKEIIKQKLIQNFVLTLVNLSKHDQILNQFDKLSILVCSGLNNGEILSSNQLFKKAYQPKKKKRQQKQKIYIGDMLPTQKQKTAHENIFLTSTQYQSQAKEQKTHKDYTCYITKYIKESQQNENFIKSIDKVSIYTRIYFSLNQQFNYICTLQKIEQSNQQGIRVLQQEINQLQKRGLFPKILKSETIQQLECPLQCFYISLKQIQNYNEQDQQMQDMEVNCSQQFDISEIGYCKELKFLKIQKSLQKQKQGIYEYQANYLLLFLLIPIIFISGTFVYQNYKNNVLKQTAQFANMSQQVIKNTILAEDVIGLELILYHHFQQGYSPVDFCKESTNVLNMTQYLKNKLINYAGNKFNSFESMYLLVSFQQQPLIQLLKSNSYSWYQLTAVKNILMDYLKYIAFLKSFTFHFSQPFQEPQQKYRSSFLQTITYMMNIQENNFKKGKDFYYQIIQAFNSVSFNLKNQFIWSYLFSTLFTVILFAFFCFFLSKMIINQIKHLLLLKSFKRDYFINRQKQIKFMNDQLKKIENNEYEKVKISRGLNILIQTNNQTKVKSFEQLQKQSQQICDQNNNIHNAQNQEKNESQKISLLSKSRTQNVKKNNIQNFTLKMAFLETLLNSKYWIILFLFFIFGLFSCHIVQNSILIKKIQRNFQYYNVVEERYKVQDYMVDILSSEWLLFINKSQYVENSKIQERLKQALEYLNTSNYIRQIRTTFDNESAYNILYESYCNIYGLQIQQQCLNFYHGVLQQGLAFLVSMVVNDAKRLVPIKSNYPYLYQQEICTKLIINLNYTSNSFGLRLARNYNKLNSQFLATQQNIYIFQILLSIGLILSSILFGLYLYKTSKKTREQLLSMQSKTDLYQKYEDFRPYLNQLYYRREE